MIPLKNALISTLTVLSLIFTSALPAQAEIDRPERSEKDFTQHHPCKAGPGFEIREEIHAAQITVLEKLTGQPHDSIVKKLEYKPLWAIIDEYKVDFEVFQNKMLEETASILKKAVVENKITQAQADRISQFKEKIGKRGPGQGKPWQFGKRNGPHEEQMIKLREDMFSVGLTTISELTGQSEETLKKKLMYKPIWAVLEEYNVDPEIFHGKMKEQMANLLEKYVADGKITEDQAKMIEKRAKHSRYQHREHHREMFDPEN
ncbi:hypothetical protein KKA14_05125 [bacterium]|nr:hypothetical protein [bacterium]